ncbi:MAG: ribonuclease III [candidate division Zixibacteria bacterium]|nr:ribonuclease III [candidate division Zixibacteria bacterium]
MSLNFFGLGSKVPSHFYNRKTFRRIQKKLGHRFKQLELLAEALSHRSYTQTEPRAPFPSYERLEFLGDSVLGMIIAEELFKRFEPMEEGELTTTKAHLVNVHTLARISREIELNRYVRLSREEELAGGRERNSIIADCLEAIIGAIYLDGGIRSVRRFISSHFLAHMEEILNDQSLRNYKGELLERTQADAAISPRYEILKTEGPDHRKKFTVGVYINGQRLGTGSGMSKKEAEQHAARKGLRKLEKLVNEQKDFYDRLEEM